MVGRARTLTRGGRALLFIAAVATLAAGQGIPISAPLAAIDAAAATAPASPSPAPTPRVDPKQFIPTGDGRSTPRLVASNDPTAPKGYLEGRSQEIPGARTDRSITYRNPDGTFTVHS